jgi:hypothetical protein
MSKRIVFKDTVDRQLEDKVQDILNKKLTEREEHEKKKTVQDKLSAIKQTLIPREIPKPEIEHIHTHVTEKVTEKEKPEDGSDCPTCGPKGSKHTIKIVGRVAKCTGPDCGNEYLLEQKIKKPDKSKRKDLLCTTCGHSMSEEDIKGKETCPLCETGKQVMKVNWIDYDSGKLAKTRVI